MMAESTRRYNLRDTRKKPQGVLLKRWEVEYSKLISNENRRIPLEAVMSAIRSSFKDSGIEQWRITLKCPLSGQRIRVPARYGDCTHIECFDLEAFIRMKTQKNIRVCPICQKEIEKPLENLRIDKYMENVLSTLPDGMQVELMQDGSFTEVLDELVIELNVIDDEESYVQEVKQEALEDGDEYITLSDGEDEFMMEISVDDMKPIYLMPLNADIKLNIAASSVAEQIHSREDQGRQARNAEISHGTSMANNATRVSPTRRSGTRKHLEFVKGVRVSPTRGSGSKKRFEFAKYRRGEPKAPSSQIPHLSSPPRFSGSKKRLEFAKYRRGEQKARSSQIPQPSSPPRWNGSKKRSKKCRFGRNCQSGSRCPFRHPGKKENLENDAQLEPKAKKSRSNDKIPEGTKMRRSDQPAGKKENLENNAQFEPKAEKSQSNDKIPEGKKMEKENKTYIFKFY